MPYWENFREYLGREEFVAEVGCFLGQLLEAWGDQQKLGQLEQKKKVAKWSTGWIFSHQYQRWGLWVNRPSGSACFSTAVPSFGSDDLGAFVVTHHFYVSTYRKLPNPQIFTMCVISSWRMYKMSCYRKMSCLELFAKILTQRHQLCWKEVLSATDLGFRMLEFSSTISLRTVELWIISLKNACCWSTIKNSWIMISKWQASFCLKRTCRYKAISVSDGALHPNLSDHVTSWPKMLRNMSAFGVSSICRCFPR